jgi:hypothetical protein
MLSPDPALGVRTPVHLWAFLLRRAGVVAAIALTASIAYAATTLLREDAIPVPVELTVEFKLAEVDYDPLPHQNARVVIGGLAAWQQPESGRTFQTGANGVYTWRTTAALERQMRICPHDRMPRLLRRPEPVTRLQVAVGLGTAGREQVHVLQLSRCRDEDVQLDQLAVYSRNRDGTLTPLEVASGAKQTDGASGFEPWNHSLEPDDTAPGSGRWILRLGFKRTVD